MTTLRKALVALAEYRPSPFSEVAIPLGVIVAAEHGGDAAIGMSTRNQLSAEEVAKLDGVSRALLQDPTTYFRAAVESQLARERDPAALLRELSAVNNSSLTLTDPREIDVRVRMERGGDLAVVGMHIAQHLLEALRSGKDPFKAFVQGQSGELSLETVTKRNETVEPHVAAWANQRDRGEWHSVEARAA